MKNINVIKMGNMVNLSIDGRLHKKNCGNPQEADELFRAVLNAKADPSDENIKKIKFLLNEKLRIALMAGIEADVETGEAFLAGFNTPIPETLLEVIKEYVENDYPIDAIINFWSLLMINPDTRVRTSLFDFIKTHDFVLTDKGYMVVYKAVKSRDVSTELKTDVKFKEFISNSYLQVKKTWKSSPYNYVVYLNAKGTIAITKESVAVSWGKDVEILGNLGELYAKQVLGADVVNTVTSMYTDMHTKSMDINLGVPVKMDRKECDSDPAVDCSYGLHVGATAYVEKFGCGNRTILACLVNPANVVAVPNYDHSKMRVTEYFPFATATYVNGKIDIIEQKYFEDDYCEYEIEELEAQIQSVKANEIPIETAIEANVEGRPMSELLKILEERLYVIC